MTEMILLTPGPVMVSQQVLHEFSQPLIFHRYNDFEFLFKETCQKLLKLFNANSERFSIAIFTGSGTLANESVLSSVFTSDDKVFVISNGDFGERLAKILTTHKINIFHLKLDWFTPIDPEQVLDIIQSEKLTAVALVAMETSTGMRNPVHSICDILIANQYEHIPVFVDAISAVGYEDFSLDNSSIKYITGVLNKGLEAPPGLSFACVDRVLIEKHSRQISDSVYLDLHRYLDFYKRNQTPTTPSVSHIKALNIALERLSEETLVGRRFRYSYLTKTLIEQLTPVGFIPFINNPKLRASSMVCFKVPPNINVDQLKQFLYENGIVVWFPKHCSDIVQKMIISVMGNVTIEHINKVTDLIETFALSVRYRTI